MRTVILGNGVIALSIAFRLIKRLGAQDSIVVVGKKSRPGSATLAAAAMLNSFAEIEVGSLESEIDLYRFELSHLATRMWPKFERELIVGAGGGRPSACAECEGCSGGGCYASGTYIVNNASADDLDDESFDAILKALNDFSEPFESVSPADIPNYAPVQRHRATRALYLPNEGWFNPRIMMEKLDAAVGRCPQVTFLDAQVDRLVKQGAEIDSAILDNGEIITGDKFILATGATCSDILDKSDLGIPVQRVFYGVGVSIEIQSPDSPHTKCIRIANRGLACGLYSVPYFTSPKEPLDHILVGASSFISAVPYNHGRLINTATLMQGAVEQINTNFYRANLIRVNVGWRPTSQDTYPLIGKTSLKNLLIATGTKRDGFHLAPLISERMVSLLFDEDIDGRFEMFRPERPLIQSLTREEAIEKAVRHQISAAYQHGFQPATDRTPDQVAVMYRGDLERLHDQVGAVDWGIPPEMLDMYRYGHVKPKGPVGI